MYEETKQVKPRPIAESLILIAGRILRPENEINKISLSDNTIVRHITDLLEDININVKKNIMNHALYCIQIESCDNKWNSKHAIICLLHSRKKII